MTLPIFSLHSRIFNMRTNLCGSGFLGSDKSFATGHQIQLYFLPHGSACQLMVMWENACSFAFGIVVYRFFIWPFQFLSGVLSKHQKVFILIWVYRLHHVWPHRMGKLQQHHHKWYLVTEQRGTTPRSPSLSEFIVDFFQQVPHQPDCFARKRGGVKNIQLWNIASGFSSTITDVRPMAFVLCVPDIIQNR